MQLRLLYILLLLPGLCFAQSGKVAFVEEYEAATKIFETQKLDETLQPFGVNPNIAKAVVFPEVMRYNTIQDKIETTALKTLYVQYGIRYANFSVGQFQMKPSFAEELEHQLTNKHFKDLPKPLIDTSNTPQARKERVARLSSDQGQLFYLAIFMLVVQNKFPELENLSEIDKVRFYATAYNYTFNASFVAIVARQPRKEFHTDTFGSRNTTRYRYSDLASGYYEYLKATPPAVPQKEH